MTTTKILSAVSAAALLGISSFALAQAPGGSSGGSMQKEQPSGATSPSSTSPSATSPGSTSKEMNKDATKDQKANQAQQKEMGKDSQKSQAQQEKMGKDSQKSTQQEKMGTDSQKSQAQSPAGADSKSKMGQDSTKSGTTVGAATSGGVNLTTEQRTTIRQSVLTANAPRATNINFAVNVGTVVPSSVRVVEVPDVIVRIHPAWRGFRYFVYNDDIVIVEPRTLKIVAVLNV